MPQLVSATAILVVACSYPFLTATAASMAPMIAQSASPATASSKTERHLRNIRKLTSGGENAEAYFSADGTRLVYQSTRPEYPCDQIYTMKIDGSEQRRVSTGTGRTTCGYFYPAGDEILFASTHESGAACPPHPSFERGYVWPIYASYDIYRAKADGTNLRPLTRTPGYDAEATIAPDGLITFTSVRDGDMEIYTMKADGSDVRRLTNRPGPDGGPFFSFDGKRIAFRSRPLEAGKELDEYRALLKEGLWRPTQLELFVMNRDGSALRQLTTLGGANFAPSWHPDGKRLVFASNLQDPKGRDFDVYLINVDGTGLERLTFSETFDGFPMFSPDGKHLVFASNRQAAAEGETNVFIAEWWNRSRVRGFAGSRFAGSRVRPEVLEKQPATAPASPTRTKERDMHTSLTELLRLTSPPVAITFLESPPANVPHVSAVEPAGCGYWRRAAEGEVFYTSADDHKRCPVGAHTHNVSLSPAEQQELMGLVQTMVGLSYLKMEEVPQIPTRKTPMQIAVYASLEASPAPPEVVLVRGNAQQLMLLAEAAQAAGISGTGVTMGRPTCAVLPEAINTDRTAASFGCVGNRVYTGAAETDAYFAIPGSQLAPLEASLAVIVRANQELAKFHQARAAANS